MQPFWAWLCRAVRILMRDPHEAFLAGATDLADLEKRERAIERGDVPIAGTGAWRRD